MVSGALGAEKLKEIVHHTDNVVVMKVYRNYKEIMDTLNDLNLTSRSILISHCGLEEEEIIRNIEDRPDEVPPYLSLLLIRKNDRG